MRILITGGAGFQGSHLAEKWSGDGHTVTILNTYSAEAEENISGFADDVSTVWGSITDPEIVEKSVRGHDVVVHLAARINVDESIASPRSFIDVNLSGTFNILQALRQTGARMIFASSCEVYGYAEQPPVDESAELRPHSPYAASKAAADRMCFAYEKSFGVDITIVRPCNIYGERQKWGKGGAVIPIFASLAAAGKPLTVFGSGDQQREYMHVTDLVGAYDLVLGRTDLSGSVLNVGTGDTPSVKDIAEFIADKMGVQVVNEAARPGEVAGFALDNSTIRDLGFAPQIKFWDGLSRYLEGWRDGTPQSR